MELFFGRTVPDWCDIYLILLFRGKEPKSFKDLFAWYPPSTPQGCMDLAFELAEARAEIKEIPVLK